MKHNKLVRDNIPAMVARSGEQPITRTLNVEEFQLELRRKLQEEVNEFYETSRIEELADILEIDCHGSSSASILSTGHSDARFNDAVRSLLVAGTYVWAEAFSTV
jgi:predicted house-cleaning noncanonical NTP pyrophosphatase (MazG superfamily)